MGDENDSDKGVRHVRPPSCPAMERRNRLGQPSKGNDGDGDAQDEVDRLERRLVAVADDRDFNGDPDQQRRSDGERGKRRERMPCQASRPPQAARARGQ